MTQLRSHTTIEQSKMLMEIGIPNETADMYFIFDIVDDYYDVPSFITESAMDIPCWSLSALLYLLPNDEHIETGISKGSWKIDPVEYLPNTWWCEYEDTKNQTEFNISADNPIDVCYKMIIKLKEQNLL